MPIFNGIEFNETQNLHINNQISNYVLGIFDPSKLIIMDLATANTVTIPNDSSVDFLIGTRIYVLQSGVGQTSILASLGVTINSQSGILSLASQYCMCELIKTTANTWTLQGGIIPPPIPATNYGLFAQTALGTPVTFVSGQASLIGTGVGTLTVPPNAFQVGDSFFAKMCGSISCANNEDIQIRVKSNGNIIADAGIFTLNIATNKYFELALDFTITKIGGLGVAELFVNGQFTYNKNANSNIDGNNFALIDNTAFDTTTTNLLSITAEWITASPINIIQSQNFVLNKIY